MEELKQKLDSAKALSILKNSEGGKEILKIIGVDSLNIINNILGNYKTANHIELISLIAQLESLTNISNNIMNSDESVRILKEEYDNNKEDKKTNE